MKGMPTRMPMARLALTLALAALVAAPADAQTRRAKRNPEAMFDMMAERLELTPEQKLAAAPIMREHTEAMRELRQGGAKDEQQREAVLAEWQALQEKLETRMVAILDKDQLAKFQSMQKAARQRVLDGAGTGRRAPP